MKVLRKRVGLVLAGAALVAASCSSGGDQTSTEVAQDTAAPTTTLAPASSTTTELEATTTAPEPDEVPMITIEGELTFDRPTSPGTFEVTAGSGILGCESGTMAEYPSENKLVYEMECSSGTRSGTFITSFAPSGGGKTVRSPWDLVFATGDFGDLSGSGDWTGVLNADNSAATFTLTGDIAFGEVAEPLSSVLRPVQTHLSNCFSGFISRDGLFEYATVDGEMLRVDLSTGEVTEHGSPPSECSWWLGDEAAGRRVAVSLPAGGAALPDGKTKVWFGPFDGPWEAEREFDEITIPLSRSFAGNRLVFSHPDSGTIFILDATTGEQVGPTITGAFGDERTGFSANATSPDGAFIALGGANPGGADGGGIIFVLDAETGEELFQVDTATPVAATVFDDATGELVAGLVTGELITIDLASQEVVSEVRIDATAGFEAIGIRPDGLLVVYTEPAVELVDRHTGPTGAMINLRDPDGARIRPDGTIGSFGTAEYFEVYEIDG